MKSKQQITLNKKKTVENITSFPNKNTENIN